MNREAQHRKAMFTEDAGTGPVSARAALAPGEMTSKAAAKRAAISLVLPMFNEGEVVDRTLTAAVRSLERDFRDFEIVVSDDGSTDDSAAQVQRWASRDPRIVLVRGERNERFGGALRRGLEAASKDWIFYTDFDLPVELDCFPGILGELQRSDMVTGYSAEVPKNLGWDAKSLSIGYNLLVRMAFGLPLRDINFGFKAMRKSVRDQLRLTSRSPFADAEMFIQAGRNGHSIREVPVPFLRRQAGVSRIRRFDVVAWTLWDMARIWLRAPMKRHPKTKSQAEQERAGARETARS